MEQPQYLIDTNAVIDYLGKKLPDTGINFMNGIIDNVPNVSIVSKIEVLGFNTTDDHYQLLANFMNDSNVLELSDIVVDACIDVRKKYKIKLPDAIIAATTLVHGLILISRNTSDFISIEGLKTIDPHNLADNRWL